MDLVHILEVGFHILSLQESDTLGHLIAVGVMALCMLLSQSSFSVVSVLQMEETCQ